MPLLLSGCAQAPSNVAPDVVEYSKETQNLVANEVEGGYCPMSTEMLKDFSVSRDQSRVTNK